MKKRRPLLDAPWNQPEPVVPKVPLSVDLTEFWKLAADSAQELTDSFKTDVVPLLEIDPAFAILRDDPAKFEIAVVAFEDLLTILAFLEKIPPEVNQLNLTKQIRQVAPRHDARNALTVVIGLFFIAARSPECPEIIRQWSHRLSRYHSLFLPGIHRIIETEPIEGVRQQTADLLKNSHEKPVQE